MMESVFSYYGDFLISLHFITLLMESANGAQVSPWNLCENWGFILLNYKVLFCKRATTEPKYILTVIKHNNIYDLQYGLNIVLNSLIHW